MKTEFLYKFLRTKFRTNHIELEEITFNVDGEKLTDNHFVIDIIPKAISVYNDKRFCVE